MCPSVYHQRFNGFADWVCTRVIYVMALLHSSAIKIKLTSRSKGRALRGEIRRGALQRQNAENLKQIFPEKEYRGLSPNLHIHVSVSELYILTSAFSAGGNMWTDPGNI
jgi:hypothetical protein